MKSAVVWVMLAVATLASGDVPKWPTVQVATPQEITPKGATAQETTPEEPLRRRSRPKVSSNQPVIPITYDPNNPPPLCSLSTKEMSLLNTLTFKKFDADVYLLQPLTELWSSRFKQEKVPFCLKTYVKRTVEDGMLRQISVIKNVNTKDQEETISFLEKIDTNVFLVRKAADKKPIARIYIIHASINALVFFQCSTEPPPVGKVLSRIFNRQPAVSEHSLPDNGPLQKMAVLSIPQHAVDSITRQSVKDAIAEAQKVIKDNQELFGHTAETAPCVLGEGDIEKSIV